MRGTKHFTNPALLERWLLVALLGLTKSVVAQPAADPAPVAAGGHSSASALTLADGDRLSRSGDWNGALDVYRNVHRASPSPESQQRIASALDHLDRFGDAYAAYAVLLDEFAARLPLDRKLSAETRLRELDNLTGIVVFDGLDQQSTIRVDGVTVEPTAIARPLRVNRGEVRFEIAQTGRSAKTVRTTVVAGLQHVDANLSSLATTGTLDVTAATPTEEATLLVDGRAMGPLPQHLALAAGMHELAAVGQTTEAHRVSVQLESGKSIAIGLNFVPRAAQFDIDPGATDAVLWVDRQALGTGKRRLTLPPGQHELELRRTGYKSQKLALVAKPGQQQQLRAAAYVAEPHSAAVTPNNAPPLEHSAERASSTAVSGESLPPSSAATNSAAVANAGDAAPPSNYTGIFGSFIVPLMLGGKSTHSYVDDCPAKAYGGACTTSAPRGGGLGLRLGYFYEWIGLEVVGAGAVDVSTTELKLPPIPTISSSMQDAAGRNVFVRAGGMIGLGVRLAVPMQGLRFTVGADYLYVYRKVIAIPDSFAGASLAYSVPGWFIDGGIQLGSTPGARFYLGAFVLIEQAHDLPLTRNLAAMGVDPALVPAALTQMTIYHGRQVFYGPLLGIAFGH